MLRVGIVGDYNPHFAPHPATAAAIEHAAVAAGLQVESIWLSTQPLEDAGGLADLAALWIAPGSPYISLSGALSAIRHARESNLPLLATCGGFQHVVIEYARNVLGLTDAAHAEYDPYASRLFISRLACSLMGQTMEVRVSPGSQAARAYGELTASEQYYCNFAIDPSVYELLFARELAVTGIDREGAPRIVELPGHRFFVATLFVPQMRSAKALPHPLVTAWLAAAASI